jgi:hypothetical protein
MFYFLGVTPIESKSSHKKINPDNLVTLINNLEEVKSSLKGSDLYKYIEMWECNAIAVNFGLMVWSQLESLGEILSS